MNDYVLALIELASLAVATVAIVVAVRGVRDQLRLQTFSEYTRRYAEVFRTLPSVARDPNAHFSLEDVEPVKRDELLNTARAYFNLCSEEFYLQKRNRIDPVTWRIWCRGMKDTLRLPWLRQVWDEIGDEYTYVDEFAEFFDSLIHQPADRRSEARSTRGSADA